MAKDAAALLQNMQDYSDIIDAYQAALAASDAAKAALVVQVNDAVTAMNAAKAEKDAALQAISDAVDASDAAENKARAGLPGVPPVGVTPLATSYASRADFDAAVAAYQGTEQVTVDGTEVKAATDPTATPSDYYSHSADGSVSTSGPTD